MLRFLSLALLLALLTSCAPPVVEGNTPQVGGSWVDVAAENEYCGLSETVPARLTFKQSGAALSGTLEMYGDSFRFSAGVDATQHVRAIGILGDYELVLQTGNNRLTGTMTGTYECDDGTISADVYTFNFEKVL